MLSEIIHIMEYTLYIYLSVSVGYIVLFSAASHFFKQKKYPATTVRQRFIILVPAYKEDAVIHACVTSVLRQTYPAELYDLIVISDHMRPETNASLRKERIGLIELHEKESSKAKALRIAAETITDQPYDYVLILDADNLISPCYLQELNKAVSQGIKAIQTHRKAKNMNTDIALLDAAIEEMNNSIFRKGHIRLGFSSALTGSGMAFDFRWFVRNIIHTHSTGEDKELWVWMMFRTNHRNIIHTHSTGEDKELEELLLRQGIHIEYIDTLETLDEKVRQPDALRNQRRRWIATQLFLALKMGRNLPTALLNGNGDYLLKTLQAFIAPRSILLALIGFFSCVLCIFSPASSIKWWILLILLNGALYLAIPSNMRYKYMSRILRQTPYFVIIMLLNLFHLKGMAQKFNHTQHG